MKRALLFLLTALFLSAAGLHEIKTVYLLPMSNGMDQYLAVRLNEGAVLQVVTDPAKADAVFTDHIGESFREQMVGINGTKKAEGSEDGDQTNFARVGSGMRSRSTTFLVDRKSGEVLWSAYLPPANRTADALHKTAGKIAERLSQALKGK
jgi:hypothetical protein